MYTTYIPLVVLAFGYAAYHLLREPGNSYWLWNETEGNKYYEPSGSVDRTNGRVNEPVWRRDRFLKIARLGYGAVERILREPKKETLKHLPKTHKYLQVVFCLFVGFLPQFNLLIQNLGRWYHIRSLLQQMRPAKGFSAELLLVGSGEESENLWKSGKEQLCPTMATLRSPAKS